MIATPSMLLKGALAGVLTISNLLKVVGGTTVSYAGYLGYQSFKDYDILDDYIDICKKHIYINGAIGSGKTTIGIEIAFKTISHPKRFPIVWIDPNGEKPNKSQPSSSDELLAITPEWRKKDVLIIDPMSKIILPINPLATDEEAILNSDIDVLGNDMTKIFENINTAKNWGGNIEDTIRHAYMTVVEYAFYSKTVANPLDAYLFMENIEYRTEVLETIRNPILLNYWTNYNWGTKTTSKEARTAQNKFGKVMASQFLIELLCQEEGIDLIEAINQGKIIIVKLGGKFNEINSNIVASVIITKILQGIKSGRINVEFCQIFADEFQRYLKVLGKDIHSALAEFRQFNLGLVLIHQHQAQLTDEMKEAVGLCRTKYFFSSVNQASANFALNYLPKANTEKKKDGLDVFFKKERFTPERLMSLPDRVCVCVQPNKQPKLMKTEKTHFKGVTTKQLAKWIKKNPKQLELWKKERSAWLKEVKEFVNENYGIPRSQARQFIQAKFKQVGLDYLNEEEMNEWLKQNPPTENQIAGGTANAQTFNNSGEGQRSLKAISNLQVSEHESDKKDS